jgi:hypothetical protein
MPPARSLLHWLKPSAQFSAIMLIIGFLVMLLTSLGILQVFQQLSITLTLHLKLI